MGKRFIELIVGCSRWLNEEDRQRLERVDTVKRKTIYRSTLLVWVYEQGLVIL